MGSTPAVYGSVCCFEKNSIFVATTFWILLFLLPLYISQDLVWLGFKKKSDFLLNDVILWKTKAFAKLNLARGIPGIYMRVNRTIKRTPILPPGNWNLSLFIYIFSFLPSSLTPLFFFLQIFKKCFQSAGVWVQRGMRRGFPEWALTLSHRVMADCGGRGELWAGHSGFLDQASMLPWTMSSGGKTNRGWSSRKTAGLPSQSHERYLVAA